AGGVVWDRGNHPGTEARLRHWSPRLRDDLLARSTRDEVVVVVRVARARTLRLLRLLAHRAGRHVCRLVSLAASQDQPSRAIQPAAEVGYPCLEGLWTNCDAGAELRGQA